MYTYPSTWRVAGVAVIVGVAVAGVLMLSAPAHAMRDERLCRIAEKYLDKQVPHEVLVGTASASGDYRAVARAAQRLREIAVAAQKELRRAPAASPAAKRVKAALLKMFVLHEKAAHEQYLSQQHALRGELASASDHAMKALKLTEQDIKLNLFRICTPG